MVAALAATTGYPEPRRSPPLVFDVVAVRVRCDECCRVWKLARVTGGAVAPDGLVTVKPCPGCGCETATYAVDRRARKRRS